jgi:hypothetical protein
MLSRRRTPRFTARLITWLLGDEGDWITGQTTASDGGWSCNDINTPRPQPHEHPHLPM